MLLEYERQWTVSQGHAQRHPLRLKIARLEELLARKLSTEDLEELLETGIQNEDPGLGLLCVDLAPRWVAARRGDQYRGG